MNAHRSLPALLLAPFLASFSALFLTLFLTLCLALATTGPALAQSSSDLEPDITIRQEQDRTIREYRVNGELYAIEIRPSSGPSYYLVDYNGDGNFERQEGDRIALPQWILQSF